MVGWSVGRSAEYACTRTSQPPQMFMFIFMSNLFPARCGCVYVSPTNFRSFSPGHTKDLAVSPLSLSSSNHFPSSYAVFRFSTPHLYTCIGPCLLLPGRFSRQLFSVFTVFTSAVAHTYKPKEKPDAPEDSRPRSISVKISNFFFPIRLRCRNFPN